MPPRRNPRRQQRDNQNVDPTMLAALNSALSAMLPTIVSQTVAAINNAGGAANNAGGTGGAANNTGGAANNVGGAGGVANNAGGAANNVGGAGGATNNAGDTHDWFEKFQKHKPQSFSSAPNPVDAENWVSHVDKIFDVLGCPDAIKVKLATYKLEGDGQRWWKALKQAKGDAYVESLSWVQFREAFFQQYFSEADKDSMAREYANISQREDENITEFMARFLRLAGFVGAAAGSSRDQAKKFKWAVNERIRSRIVNSTYADVAEAADAAKNIEMERKLYLASKQDNGKKRSRDGKPIQQGEQQPQGQGNEGSNHNSDSKRANHGDPNHAPITQCTICGKRHPSNTCYKTTGACFACGEVGHLVKDCKKKRDPAGGGNAPRNIGGRVFALATNQAQE